MEIATCLVEVAEVGWGIAHGETRKERGFAVDRVNIQLSLTVIEINQHTQRRMAAKSLVQ